VTADAARTATLALLAARAGDATVCPSEVARAITGNAAPAEAWRAAMPEVHAAIDRLLGEGRVRLRWKGVTLAKRAGPYRIARKS